MKRLHKNILTAAVLLVGGVTVGLYTLQNKVKTPEERFRDAQNKKRLFPKLGRAHVKRATLMAKNATISFEADDTFTWKIVEPVKWRGDVEAIDAALDRMAGLTLDPIVTEDATTEDLERAGLDKPPVVLKVELRDGTKHEMIVGPRNKLADRYPVTDANKKKIGLSEPSFYWALDRTLEELRDKRLFPWAEDEVTHIAVFEPDGTVRFSLDKADDGFTTSGPGLEPIPADAGSRLLLAVAVTRNLRAEAFLTDTYDPKNEAETKKYGLDQPILRLEIGAGDDIRRAVLARHAERKDEALTLHIEGTGVVVDVKPGIEQKFDTTAIDLRDRTVMRFEKNDVKRIRFQYAGREEIAVIRTGDSEWMLEGSKKPAKIWKVDGVLRGFSYLKGKKLHAANPSKADLVEWLLDPFSRRLIFEGQDQKVLGSVRIGKYAVEGLMFIKADDASPVFLVDDKKIEILPKSIADVTDEER